MQKYILAVACSILLVGTSFGSPEDSELARRLVGEWQGGRHAEQYMPDGTFRLDPAQGTTHGTWRISNGKLTTTYQLTEPPGEKSVTYQIVVLDNTRLVLRNEKGMEFKSSRMAGPLPQN